MEHLAYALSHSLSPTRLSASAMRRFARLRKVCGLIPGIAPRAVAAPLRTKPLDAVAAPLHAQSFVQNDAPREHPAFARVPLRQTVPPIFSGRRAAACTNPVRVYHGASRLVLVGHIDEVCQMIDRYIAAENTGLAIAATA
jgi:hypothetical protein